MGAESKRGGERHTSPRLLCAQTGGGGGKRGARPQRGGALSCAVPRSRLFARERGQKGGKGAYLSRAAPRSLAPFAVTGVEGHERGGVALFLRLRFCGGFGGANEGAQTGGQRKGGVAHRKGRRGGKWIRTVARFAYTLFSLICTLFTQHK